MSADDQDAQGDSSQRRLERAIACADVEEILRLLDDATLDLDHRDVGHDLQTPLMRMCHMRFSPAGVLEALVEKLERCAWNPNVQDVTGRTLLMHACIATRLPVVLLCLDNGCDVSLADRDGNSALVYAVRSGGDDMVRVFLELEECRPLLGKGNNMGQIPLDVALQDGLDTIATLLSSHLPSLPLHSSPSTTLSKATLTPGSTFAPPSPLTPRSPVGCRQEEEGGGIRRTLNEAGPGLGLQTLWSNVPRQPAPGTQREEGEGQRPSAPQGDTVHNVSGRLSAMTSLHRHPSRTTPHPLTLSSREVTSCSEHPRRDLDSHAMTSRESTSYSEVGEKSPRRAQRKKQRLLRRQAEDFPSSEVAEGVQNTPRGKPRAKDLHLSTKDYASLPDLRDFKGKLVTSGEVTPVGTGHSSLQSSLNSSGGRGEGRYDDDNDPATQPYMERYKSGDLPTSCTLPPLQSSSADSADRRKERGGKLVHRGKANSTDDVMLRSLIV